METNQLANARQTDGITQKLLFIISKLIDDISRVFSALSGKIFLIRVRLPPFSASGDKIHLLRRGVVCPLCFIARLDFQGSLLLESSSERKRRKEMSTRISRLISPKIGELFRRTINKSRIAHSWAVFLAFRFLLTMDEGRKFGGDG